MVFHQFQIVHKYYLSLIISLAISLYSLLSNTCSFSLAIIKLTLVGITLRFRLLYAILFCLYALFCEIINDVVGNDDDFNVVSAYCMSEFEMAYHHNVAVKRRKRLIVLMALDNLNDLDDNNASDTTMLRQFIRQYTYIDYTRDDWLDKLLYALPLRGLLQRNDDQEMADM